MRTLSDIPADRLMVECGPCRRAGAYRVDRLIAQHGAACPLRAVLEAMRARCGAMPCRAQLVVPMRIDLDRPTYPGNTFALDIWESDQTIEMGLGAVCVHDVASAAFDRAVALWPHSTVTIRLKAQILRAHRPEDDQARAAQAQFLARLGLR